MSAISQPRDYVRALATAAALFYPLYWLFQSVLGVAPALLGSPKEALAAAPNVSLLGVTMAGGGLRGTLGWETWAVVALVSGALCVWGRRDPDRRAAVGFGLAVWAFMLGRGPVGSIVRSGSVGLDGCVLLAAALGSAAVGFAWMLPATGEATRRLRSFRLGLLFGFPAFAALWSLALLAGFPLDFLARRELPAALLITGLGAIVGRRGIAGDAPRPRPTWRGAWVGVAASVLVFVGSQRMAQAVEESEQARREAAIAAAPENRPLPAPREPLFFKGVNFTAEWPARYDTEQARETLEALPGYGVNSIALVPYASAQLGSPKLRFPLNMERDAGIRFMTSVAHAAGLRVLLKPQVWYRGGYPGDHDLESEADLDAFFANYRLLVEHYAKLAEEMHADMFCVGVEFAKLSRHSDQWRDVIAAAREHYSGPLTYAANFGAEFESVRFWDDLDYIGLDNYYPLPANLATSEVSRRIEAVHREFGKPVLFTEVGFTHHDNTYEKPWEDQPGGAMSPEMQARCYEAIFEGFYDKPWLEGMFWWKVGSAGAAGRGGAHSPWGLPAMEVLKDWYWKL